MVAGIVLLSMSPNDIGGFIVMVVPSCASTMSNRVCILFRSSGGNSNCSELELGIENEVSQQLSESSEFILLLLLVVVATADDGAIVLIVEQVVTDSDSVTPVASLSKRTATPRGPDNGIK